ncbi:radical SAM/SPASM domain-containing protein [Thermosipho atlanticus]|uniref:Radical SAM additional 4Fe4S-binding SPASM domain-containing protein n=1 Tax=Thermosipho atlanticus DSM 15807 TaxID=1123380 RepID=A0A1M5S3C9_9BACT|nr:radical SAM protein [Thermosipho atlanticus]SHH32808.1 radical SAM additional 4Fe4S-binding SPASM domain-containing protein [Thermosipho atlanticus DSM 15807]
MRKAKIVEVELTTICNYSCLHCYCFAGKPSSNELTTEEVKKVIKDLYEAGVEIIDLVGGEPLTRKDIFELISYGRKLGANLMLNTNASLATKQVVKKLKEVNPDLHIGISIDGHIKKIHEFVRGAGTFEKTMTGLQNFLTEGFNVTILHVINKQNYKYFEDMVQFARKFGMNLYVDRFVPVGRGELFKDILTPTKEMIQYVNEIIKKYANEVNFYVEENISGGECTAGKTHASVLVDGTVVPCGHFRYDPEYYMGNIKKMSFKEIWEAFDPSILTRDCENCKLFEECKGGCRAFAKKLGLTHDPIFCEVNDSV